MRYLLSFLVAVLLPSIAFANPPQNTPGPDRFPNGCVDCHVQLPDRDVRLSTVMKQWSEQVPPALLEKARRVAGSRPLTGRHPAVTRATTDVPVACLSCHGRESTVAPPLGSLLHAIHLGGGEKNHFIALFDGSCTHCHKVADDGQLTVASGAERP